MPSNSTPRKLKVFLCHSSDDKPAVRSLYKQLYNAGFSPWFDEEDLVPGQDWQREINKAVRAADFFLVCLSTNSVTKTGYVQKEIKSALDIAEEFPDETVFIIPVRLEDCEVPERLRRWHWVNLFEQRGFDRLLRALTVRATSLGIEVIPITSSGVGSSIDEQNQNSLTFDSKPLLGKLGKIWTVSYDLYSSITDLLNDIYFSLENHVAPYKYADEWILQDKESGKIFIDVGTKWAVKYYEQYHRQWNWDDRTLSDVGLVPGMHLDIIWPSRLLLKTIENQTHLNSPLDKLSERELEILKLIGQSKPMTEIASTMNLSTSTVKHLTSEIYSKLGVTNRNQAVLVAKGCGL